MGFVSEIFRLRMMGGGERVKGRRGEKRGKMDDGMKGRGVGDAAKERIEKELKKNE